MPRSPRSTTSSQVLGACEDEEIFSPRSITSPRVQGASEDESEEDVEGTNDVEGTDRTDWAAASDGAHLSAYLEGPSREPCVGMLCKFPGCKNDRKILCEHGKCSSCCRRGRAQFGHECTAHGLADLEPRRNISGGSVRLHGKASRPNNESLKRNRRRGKASRAKFLARL